MFFYNNILERSSSNNPVKACLIGAGKFGSMFLSQVPTTVGLKVTSIIDINPEKAIETCQKVGWKYELIIQTNFAENLNSALQESEIDIVVEATGDPVVGALHALTAIENNIHVVMANVEADALVGPELARAARTANVVYSMAYGDQPALACELVEWGRVNGFNVVAAGKGTKYLPTYHESTPSSVWEHYGLTAAQALEAGMNSKMFNSFLDGTKSAIEMAALSNSTGLLSPTTGLTFPPCGVDNLSEKLKPKEEGGLLEKKGQVEVVSSLERNSRPVIRDLRWGVFVVLEAPNEYSAACLKQYGIRTDDTGRYAAMYKPFHLIGLELNISVMSAVLLRKPTGSSKNFCSDVVSVAKKNLKTGEILDGEGGYSVWGKLSPAEISLAKNALPIGLANRIKLKNDVIKGQMITWNDVEISENLSILKLRRRMESRIKPK